jgi:hypothetical protein
MSDSLEPILSAIEAYANGESDERIVRDMLADLMHYCDTQGINFEDELAETGISPLNS